MATTHLKSLAADVRRLEAELRAAKERLLQAQIEACGVSVGDVVVSKGKRYRVCEVDPSWAHVWVKGNPQRLDGTWGASVRNLFDSWTKELAE